MKQAGKTPPFRDPRGEPVSGSIAEAHYLRIGGIDQWVLISGERATNPPLVLLHGGRWEEERRASSTASR